MAARKPRQKKYVATVTAKSSPYAAANANAARKRARTMLKKRLGIPAKRRLVRTKFTVKRYGRA